MADPHNDVTPTLPHELLSFIFRECLSSGSDYLPLLRPDRTSAPLNLTWVNRQWREVALSTPELWQSIALPNQRARLTSPDPNPTRGVCELLKLYICRSGSDLPLSFAFDYGGLQTEEACSSKVRGREELGSEEHVAGIHRLALVIDGVRHRWCVIVVRCRALEALSILLSSLVLGAPLLEYLLLAITPLNRSSQCPDSEGHDEDEEHILGLARCPKVSNVVLRCPQLRLHPFTLDDAPLENLTSLTLSASDSQPDAFTWLQSSPNLETISIQFIDAPPFALPHSLPLTLECLTRFTLACVSGTEQESSDPSSFLHVLRLPALRVFELLMDGSLRSDQGWPNVVELLRRSGPRFNVGPPLEELELLGTPMSASQLSEALGLAPKLKKLTIDDALTSDEVLERLSSPISSGSDIEATRLPLCPDLETLVLHGCSASLPVLANMASSRCYRTADVQDEIHSRLPVESVPNEKPDLQSNDRKYRTLKTLELVNNYFYLPTISENPVFKICQEDGLEIKQRPGPTVQCRYTRMG